MRWESILRAPGLGQCCLYRIQLFTAHLQLDPKQCSICAITGFLRQRGRALSLLSTLCPSHPHMDQGGTKRRLGDGWFLPTKNSQGL